MRSSRSSKDHHHEGTAEVGTRSWRRTNWLSMGTSRRAARRTYRLEVPPREGPSGSRPRSRSGDSSKGRAAEVRRAHGGGGNFRQQPDGVRKNCSTRDLGKI
ncbi:hypothetical protein PVAP13_J684006 [Panicum virgatum]|nr:hypothetical protein PVAP13_J684006 [Panicum virgatum]